VVLFVRYGIPLALIILGIVMLVLSGGHLSGVQDNASESNVFTTTMTDRDSMLSAMGVAAIVIALMALLLNWMLRMNADEAGDRKREDDAREHLRRTGHWPDES
jgi:TctA family transporter